MTVSPDSWAVQQHKRFKTRRRFMRDFLLQQIVFKWMIRLTIHDLDHIPDSGSTILMINHRTAIDPIAAAGVVQKRDVIVMSKIENFNHPIAGILVRNWGCYPIRRGEVDRQALKTTFDLLELGELVLIAPEGTRRPQLQKPKEGLTYLALKTDPVIVPTGVYHTEKWVRGLFSPFYRPNFHIAFGKPFRIRGVEQRRVPKATMQAISDEMMYQLAALLPEDYRGEYADLGQMTTEYLEFL